MPYRLRHLTDREILMTLDGEMTPNRQIVADRHLAECIGCQQRRTQFAEASVELALAHLGAELPDEGPSQAVRDTLRSRLRDAADEPPGGLWQIRSYMPSPLWSTVGLVALAVFTVVTVMSSRVPAPQAGSNGLPNSLLTPGATWNLTAAELCANRSRAQRPIAQELRDQVIRAYRMEDVSRADYELDYLITPQLGGAADIKNLWPERYAAGPWNALVKDQLEQLLPQMVCRHEVALETAQRDIAHDWISAYKKYFKTSEPIESQMSMTADPRGDDDLAYPVWRSKGAPALQLIAFAPRP